MYRFFWTAVVGMMGGILLGALGGCEKPVGNQRADDGTADTDLDKESLAEQMHERDTCANLDLTLTRQPVTILLVVDHSASMNQQMGDNDTRWSVVVNALMGTGDDSQTGLVRQLEDRVRFGMMLFTAVRNEPETCPILHTVPPALFNAQAIADICRADDPTYKGASPVPEAIRAAVDTLAELDDPGRRIIVLATDGLPQTCQTLAQNDDDVGRSETIAAVTAAWSEGISTFVVGVGDEPSADYLQTVANAGVGRPLDGADAAPYYQGATENSLLDAIFDVITIESRSCVYELDGKGVAPGEEEKGHVLLDGEELIRGDEDYGWHLVSPGEIEFLGRACDEIQVGDHRILADFPCESLILIE